MLTKNEREWLDEQRAILMHAASEVDVCTRELIAAATFDDRTRAARVRRAKELARLERLRMHWDNEIFRRHLLITAWIAAYEVTSGGNRGPIPTSLPDLLRGGLRR